MKLLWNAEEAKRRGIVGLVGWPASDHEEPDLKVAKAKLKTGLYSEAKAPTKKGEAEV